MVHVFLPKQIQVNACMYRKQEKENAHSKVPFLLRAQYKHYRRKHFASLNAFQFFVFEIGYTTVSSVQ